jgi:hypothetical protein
MDERVAAALDASRVARERAVMEYVGALPEGFEARRPIYDAVTFLGVSGFFDEWEHRFDGPTEELAERVRSKMERRLAEIQRSARNAQEILGTLFGIKLPLAIQG